MSRRKRKIQGTVLLSSAVLSAGVGASNVSASETTESSASEKSFGFYAMLTSGTAAVCGLAIAAGKFFSTYFTRSNPPGENAYSDPNSSKNVEDFLDERISGKVPQNSFFEKITGYTEEEFRKNPEYIKSCIKKNNKGEYEIFHKNGKDVFSAGTLDILSMKTINNFAKKKLKRMNRRKTPGKPGELNVLGINKGFYYASKALKEKVDVSFLQSKKENRGKTFVAASNFNLLETLGHSDSVSKKCVTDYYGDHTQGPAVQLSAHPGAMAKLYAAFYNENKDAKEWRQTDEHQINLLDDLGIRTRNGYILENIDKIAQVTEGLKNGTLEGKFKIGYHKGVQVVANDVFNEEDGVSYFYDKDQKVDQIYIAGVSLDTSDVAVIKNYSQKNGIATDKDDKYFREILSAFAKEVMKLNIKAALKSAFVKGRKEIVLTLVGCGVFGNDPRWFLEALEQNKDFIRESGLKVTLNISDAGTKFPEFYEDVAKLVKKFNESENKSSKLEIWDDGYFGIKSVEESVINS